MDIKKQIQIIKSIMEEKRIIEYKDVVASYLKRKIS